MTGGRSQDPTTPGEQTPKNGAAPDPNGTRGAHKSTSTTTSTSVPRLVRACGCPLDHHECGLEVPFWPSVTPCWECAALGVRELQLMGWQHGGCVHLAVAS